MTYPCRLLLLCLSLWFFIPSAFGQGTISTTITEPALLTIDDMFKLADTVVLVKIISADSENYKVAVYKGEVLQSFKGSSEHELIYFGPYIGMRLGWEYVLFLRKTPQDVAPLKSASAGFGRILYLEVFNQGYSSMETSYECKFPAKDPKHSCDYAVRVCTDYIKLPKSIKTSPPTSEDTPFGCRLVRKRELLALLETRR